MNLLAPISTIMTTNLLTVSPEDTIAHIGDLFKKHRIHHLPVVRGFDLVGLVSKSDYLFFRRGFTNDTETEEERVNNHRAKEIMVTGIAKMEPDDKINVALEIFKANLFHAIPIVEDGQLKGIVTPLDIIKHLADAESLRREY